MSEEIGVNLGRRALRQSQQTDSSPMTRRERREREQAQLLSLAAQTASVPVVENPVMPIPPPASPPVAPVAPAPVAPAPVVPPAQRPLTRRQLREMEQQTQTGVVPPVSQPSPWVSEEAAGQAPYPPHPVVMPAAVTPPVIAPVEVHAPPSTPVTGPTVSQPLPPVFDVPEKDSQPVLRSLVDVDYSQDVGTASALEVGVSSPVTHALILPVAPSVDLSGPVGDTGEVIMTGQIPLPRKVAERGLQGRLEFDGDEDADSFDSVISADTTTFTSPVRATQAVSSKVGDRQFDMVRRAPWGTAATVLGASAILLVLAAAGLVAVALWTDFLTWPF